MNHNTEIGNKKWFVAISLLGTIVSIFVFITGKNLPDYGDKNQTPTIVHNKKTLPSTPTTQPTVFYETTPTIYSQTNDWSGILSVRMPTLNEIRAEKPVSIWDDNLIDVKDMYEPGIDSYSGEVNLKTEYLLPVYWCALSSDLLVENMNSITTDFFVNGEKVPNKYVFIFNYDTNTNWHCNYYAIVLGGWAKDVQYKLEVKRTLATNLSDGQTNYISGEYIYRLVINVR